MQKTQNNAKNVALAGIFSAIIILLQLGCWSLKIGPVPITLTLVPIVLGGAIMGVKYAAVLGAAFGLAAFILGFGISPFETAMMEESAVLFFAAAMVKGILAAVASAFVYSLLKNKNQYFAVIVAAMVAPIVNTGTFLIFFVLGFQKLLMESATALSVDAVGFIFGTILLVNFVPEFIINVLLAPAILRVIKAVKK